MVTLSKTDRYVYRSADGKIHFLIYSEELAKKSQFGFFDQSMKRYNLIGLCQSGHTGDTLLVVIPTDELSRGELAMVIAQLRRTNRLLRIMRWSVYGAYAIIGAAIFASLGLLVNALRQRA